MLFCCCCYYCCCCRPSLVPDAGAALVAVAFTECVVVVVVDRVVFVFISNNTVSFFRVGSAFTLQVQMKRIHTHDIGIAKYLFWGG